MRAGMAFRGLAVIAVLFAGLWNAAPAVADDATDFVRSIADRAVDALENAPPDELESRFEAILADSFHLDFIARFSLARYWRVATPEQREEFIDVFKSYIARTYASRLGAYSGESVRVEGARPAEEDTIVQTAIRRPSGAPIRTDWRVRPTDEGPKVVDVLVEGVSMALTLRSDFTAVAQRNGVDGLIQTLRSRVAELSASG